MSEQRTASGGGPGRGQGARRLSLRIFLNYRREDSAGYAGRLWDALVESLGRDTVFMDIDTIAPGSNFVDVIDANLRNCDIALVTIGPNWLSASEGRNRRRLRNPADFVRLEIEGALARGIQVLPVLVGGARMPSAGDLPPSLQALAYRQAFELSDRRWHDDMATLLLWLQGPGLPRAQSRPPAPMPPQPLSAPSPRQVAVSSTSSVRDLWLMRWLIARRSMPRARLLCLSIALASTALGVVYFLDALLTIGNVTWPTLIRLGGIAVVCVGLGGTLVYTTHGAPAARSLLWLATATLCVLFILSVVQTVNFTYVLRFRYIYEIFAAVVASVLATGLSRFVEPAPPDGPEARRP